MAFSMAQEERKMDGPHEVDHFLWRPADWIGWQFGRGGLSKKVDELLPSPPFFFFGGIFKVKRARARARWQRRLIESLGLRSVEIKVSDGHKFCYIYCWCLARSMQCIYTCWLGSSSSSSSSLIDNWRESSHWKCREKVDTLTFLHQRWATHTSNWHQLKDRRCVVHLRRCQSDYCESIQTFFFPPLFPPNPAQCEPPVVMATASRFSFFSFLI